MPNIELKPCPFCGGKAELKTVNQCFAEAYYVRCKDKTCRGRAAKAVRSIHAAVKSWNRRSSDE